MYLEMSHDEKKLIVELVDQRLGEIGSEIRRSRDHVFRDRLKDDKATLQKILRHLRESEWDATN